MAHHVSRGDIVSCVVLTQRERLHDKVINDQMFHQDEVPEAEELKILMEKRSEVKAEDVRSACKTLRVEDLHFFGEDDGVFMVTEESVRRLARLL